MAIVLSSQENIDLLLLLVKLTIALGAIAIVMLLLFWLKLKGLEKHLYMRRKSLSSGFVGRNYPKTQRTLVANPTVFNRSAGNLTAIRKPVNITQVYRATPYPKNSKKSPKRSVNLRWRWLLAILIASVTGTAIALLQLSNGFISPEYTSLIWMLIGLGLVVSAAYVL